MMAEAEKMADDIVLIHQGKVVLQGTLDEVRGGAGSNAVHVEYEGDGAFLSGLSQVRSAAIGNNSAELTLHADADAQEVLQAAMGRIRIRKFELASPSLEQIFIEKVGTESLGHSEVAA